MRSRRTRLTALLSLTAAAVAVTVGPLPAAQADGPGVGSPWVVTLGDSYISGVAGRWAGNTNTSQQYIDALGGAAYYDAGSAEAIYRCHRSKSAEAYIGTASGYNLACSRAKTTTFTDGNGYFKPGLDFYNSGGQPHRHAQCGLRRLVVDAARADL